MQQMIKGTTPTIKYSFSTVDVADITVALLKVSQVNGAVISKDLAAATVGSNYLEWLLSQEDTLSLKEGKYAKITLDWLLDDGTRGAGNSAVVKVVESGTNEVLTDD